MTPAGTTRPPRRPRWPRLLLLVFLHGMALLIASAVTFVVIGSTLFGNEADRDAEHFTGWISAQACARPANDAGPIRSLPLSLARFNADGSLAFATDPVPLAPLPQDRLHEIASPHHGVVTVHGAFVHGCHDASGTLTGFTVIGRSERDVYARLAVLVAAVVVILGIGSIPLARSIVKPLNRLVDATRALGGGDLAARANVARRDEIGDLARAFDEMAARLEQMNRAEKELLANVSHELRTPMARIRVVLETAQEDPVLAQRYLGEIAEDLKDLERLLEDVMATARLDLSVRGGAAVELPVHLTTCELAPILEAVVARFRAHHRDRTLRTEIAGGLGSVRADAALVRRLVDNLLDNAWKYSEPATEIVLRASRTGAKVTIAVEDHGIGIDAADVPKVFTPFFRSDRSRSRATGGVGLGLALAKRIATAHHGELTVVSTAGVGTTFTFALDAVSPSDPHETA